MNRSIVCSWQVASTKRQRSDLCGLRVKLPPVTTSLTTQKRQSRQVYVAQGHNKQTCWPIFTLSIFNAERQTGKLWITAFKSLGLTRSGNGTQVYRLRGFDAVTVYYGTSVPPCYYHQYAICFNKCVLSWFSFNCW